MRKDENDDTDQGTDQSSNTHRFSQTSIRCISLANLLWFHICFPRPPSISCLKIPAQHYQPKCWKFFSCFSASDHLKGIFPGAWANIRPEMKFPLRLGKCSHRGDNGGSEVSTWSFFECQYQLRKILRLSLIHGVNRYKSRKPFRWHEKLSEIVELTAVALWKLQNVWKQRKRESH